MPRSLSAPQGVVSSVLGLDCRGHVVLVALSLRSPETARVALEVQEKSGLIRHWKSS